MVVHIVFTMKKSTRPRSRREVPIKTVQDLVPISPQAKKSHFLEVIHGAAVVKLSSTIIAEIVLLFVLFHFIVILKAADFLSLFCKRCLIGGCRSRRHHHRIFLTMPATAGKSAQQWRAETMRRLRASGHAHHRGPL